MNALIPCVPLLPRPMNRLAFSDTLAFGSREIVKIDFFIKGAQFFIKSAINGSFL